MGPPAALLGEHKHRERHRAEGAGGPVPKGQEEPGRPPLLDERTGTGGSARPSSPPTRPSAGHLLSSLFAPHGTSRHGRVPSVPPPEGRLPYDLSFRRKARLSPSSGRGPWTPSSGSPPRTWPGRGGSDVLSVPLGVATPSFWLRGSFVTCVASFLHYSPSV